MVVGYIIDKFRGKLFITDQYIPIIFGHFVVDISIIDESSTIG